MELSGALYDLLLLAFSYSFVQIIDCAKPAPFYTTHISVLEYTKQTLHMLKKSHHSALILQHNSPHFALHIISAYLRTSIAHTAHIHSKKVQTRCIEISETNLDTSIALIQLLLCFDLEEKEIS